MSTRGALHVGAAAAVVTQPVAITMLHKIAKALILICFLHPLGTCRLAPPNSNLHAMIDGPFERLFEIEKRVDI